MTNDFDNSMADWHRAEAAAADAEDAVGRLSPAQDDPQGRSVRAQAVDLRRAADELLAALRRLASAAPTAPPRG